ncbi:DNA internalization-related competence protein ComEC/Rec2 [Thiolapillus sp.]
MLLIAAGFALGVIAFQQLPVLPGSGWLLLLLPVLWCWWRFPRVGLPCAVLTGFFWGQISAMASQPPSVPEAMLEGVVLASGTIQGIPDINPRRSRFLFQASQLQQGELRLSGNWRFRVSWYGHSSRPVAGDKWILPLRLKLAHGYRNPGGFDYAGWLYARQVVHTGYVKGEGIPAGRQWWSLDRLRQKLAEDISLSGISHRSGAVLSALVVGDRSALSREDKAVFAATGTSHMIAISGLHIGLVAALVYFLVQWGWRRFPRLCCRWPATVAAAPFAMSAALVYAAMAGFSIPTQRALIMLLIVMLGILFRRSTQPPRVLGLALVAVVLWDPLSVISAGFWLSFGAVAAILFLAHRGTGRFFWLWLQLGIFLALAPLLVWQQLPVSLFSPLVNLLAIPVFATLIVPLSMTAVVLQQAYPGLGQLLMPVVGWLLDLFLTTLDVVALWSPALRWEAAPAGLLVFLGVMALPALWLTMKRTWHPLWQLSLFSILFLSLVLHAKQTYAPLPNHFRFTLMDVGQGLSVVVRTARHVLVFDTGPRFPSGFNTGSAVLLPYFENQGIRSIDKLILSHSDVDHIGGASDLLQNLQIEDVLSGEPADPGLTADVRRCVAGEIWWWDGVRFEILYPPAGVALEGNNASCVLKVSAGRDGALVTGDIERMGEDWLLKFAPGKLKSQVVVAAHHGSASSSSESFVDAARPRYVLFATGRANRWGFPREEVVERWHATGASALNTATEGAIEFNLGEAETAHPISWHSLTRRYWHN